MGPYKKVKVLVVDDSRPIRNHEICILGRMGITSIVQAGNGVEALEEIKRLEVEGSEGGELHLIICDWVMPEMDGISLLRTIKEKGGTIADTPFLFSTSQHSSSEVMEAMKLGAASYVVKPFSEYLFMNRVEKLLAPRFGRNPVSVLLIEPSGPTRKFTTSLLTELGIGEVKSFPDGRSALDSMTGEESLVLTSVVLPDIGIDEFRGVLRAKGGAFDTLPVVLMTSLEYSPEPGTILAKGFAGKVSKPFTRDSMAEVILPLIEEEKRRKWEGSAPCAEVAELFNAELPADKSSVSSCSDLTALIVDDSRAMRILLRGHLKAAGFQRIIEAANGLEAIGCVTPNLHMILCDWLMPEMNGLEFLTAVRAMKPPLNSIPFVMITGCTEKSSIMKALESGANDYIVKPIEEEKFRHKIYCLISQMLVKKR